VPRSGSSEVKAALASLVMSACMTAVGVGVAAAAAEDPVAIVRSLRAESNAAIAAHDAKRLRPLLADEYRGIQGTSGALDLGGAATARSYENEEFRDPTFVAYERIPDKVTVAASGRRGWADPMLLPRWVCFTCCWYPSAC